MDRTKGRTLIIKKTTWAQSGTNILARKSVVVEISLCTIQVGNLRTREIQIKGAALIKTTVNSQLKMVFFRQIAKYLQFAVVIE